MEAFLIVKKAHVMEKWYSRFQIGRGWSEGVDKLRAKMPFSNPACYRGISRDAISPFPIPDIEELRKDGYLGIDENTAAKLRLFEFRDMNPTSEDFGIDSSMLENLEQTNEVYQLLDEDKKIDYEIIHISKGNTEKEVGFLGYDIGIWGGEYSIICDSAIMPIWHWPVLDDIDELAEKLINLNDHLLFNFIRDANQFREYYRSKSWAEKEFAKGEFCIIEVSDPESSSIK